MKHTPGPWEVDGKRPYVIATTDGDYLPSCVVTAGELGGGGRYHIADKEVNEANADLIAEAPTLKEDNVKLRAINKELLEVCKETVECLKAGNQGQDKPLIQKMEQAISKVEGDV